MECEVCGGNLEPGTNKCEYCGHENAVAHSTEVPIGPSFNSGVTAFCPHCGSKQISVVTEKKAFNAKRAIIGGLLTGGIGLIAGFTGTKANFYLCNKCMYKWEIPSESITEKIKKAF